MNATRRLKAILKAAMPPVEKQNDSRLMLWAYVASTLLSAVLLFQLEPFVGKSLLPWYGGTPAVWNTCVFFFQLLLLLGYLYSHLLHRYLTLPRQFLVHGLVTLSALLTLPIRMKVAGLMFTESNPVASLITELVLSVGLVFFVVSTTAPLLQAWYAATRPQGSPYLIYVASNAGSLIGLLAYPAIVEFWLPLSWQSAALSWAFGGLAALYVGCGALALRTGRHTVGDLTGVESQEYDNRVTHRQRCHWFLWSLCPVSLMLGVTTHLSTQVAPMPAIWMLPLSLYLLSFIIAFAQPPSWVLRAATVGYVLTAILVSVSRQHSNQNVLIGLALHNGLMFCGALALHGQLSATRPGTRHLTEFYLWISLGGLGGSICNTLIAPLVFNWLAEYPLAIGLGLCLLPWPRLGSKSVDWFGVVVRCAMGCVVLIGLSWDVYFSDASRHVIYRHRSFYGEFHVDRGRQGVMRQLVHGGTVHGMQIASRDLRERRPPLTYYFFTGPIGHLILGNRGTPLTRSVGVVGLGIGSLAAYAERGDDYTFYEIDPAIAHVAQDERYFTYLKDARVRGATIQVNLGDARLRLREARPQAYHLLVLDAFTSDTVPVHLLTKEAILEYFSKLEPDGLLACHVSNQFLDLEPVLSNIATELGYACRVQEDHRLSMEERRRGKNPSTWLMMARTNAVLESKLRNGEWRRCRIQPNLKTWTDDHSNLLSIIRWSK